MKKTNFTFSYVAAVVMMMIIAMPAFTWAQCPVGQTEVTVVAQGNGGFTNENGWQLVNVTNNTILACRPSGISYPFGYTGMDVVTACAPDGAQLELRVFETFGDGFDGGNMTMSVAISEDGSVNGCAAQSGFLLPPTIPNIDPPAATTNACVVPQVGFQTFVLGSVACSQCTLDCPPSVSVDNDPGICGAFVSIPPPVVGADCAGLSVIFSDNFNSNQGWTMVPLAGIQNWILGPDASNDFVAWSGPLVYFSDDDAGNGVNNIVQITSPVINLSGQTDAFLSYELLYDWLGGTENLLVQGWNGGAWQTIQTFSGGDVGIIGSSTPATQNVDLAAINPAFLNANFQLRFTYDDGTGNWQWDVSFDNLSISVPGAAIALNDYNGTADASDTYPVGTTDVTFSVQTPSGGTVECTFSVTVTDAEAPVFTSCPADIVIALDPGECDAVVNYTVTATDNCAGIPVTSPIVNTNYSVGGITNAVACAFTPDIVSYYRVYDFTAQGAFDLASVEVAIFSADGTAPVTVNVYTLNGAPSVNNLTLIATNTVAAPANFGPHFLFVPVSGSIPAGSTVVVEVTASSDVFGTGTLFGLDAGGELIPTYVNGCSGFFTDMTDLNSIGFNQGILMQLNGITVLDVQQTDGTGLTSGSTFPVGTTPQTYVATDGNGLTAVCDFDIIISEFANPIAGLACNDNVQISLDETCVHVIGADEILEGGPYGCYEDYIVEMQVNGVWVPAILDDDNIDQTLTVRVTDPETGNSCWGTVSVEDKLAPTIDCEDITVNCNSLTTPGTPGLFPAIVNHIPASPVLPTGGLKAFTIPVTAPVGSTIADLNINLDFTHSWIGDVVFTLQSPGGTTVTLFDRPGLPATPPFGCQTPGGNFDFTFDDEAANAAAVLENTCPPADGAYQAVGLLSAFDGESLNGDWTLTYNDLFAGDGGNLNSVTLNITYNGVLPGPIVDDNCDVPTVTFSDVTSNFACVDAFGNPLPAGRIIRVYTVTDNSGNSATCVQTITLQRPTGADLTWPPNFDGIDEPYLLCPDADTSIANTGVPQVFGQDINNNDICDFTWAYEDHIHFICEGSYKILREWEVINWCTGEIFEHSQLIKVIDDLGPTFGGLSDITVGSNSNSCTGSILLPTGTISDNCSSPGNITVTVSSDAGTFSNNNPFLLLNIPIVDCQGTAIVTYTATDDCLNVSTTTITVTVIDDKVPTPVCDEITQVTVNSECLAVVFAETFDDGSHDNCGIDRFEVARMPSACIPVQTPFGPSVTFNCCDIGDTVGVILRVYDDCGNFNDCMVQVYIDDKDAPICLAPGDLTVNCDDPLNLWDLEQFGQPAFADNCDILAGFGPGNCNIDTSYVRIWDLDQCKEGVITRRWTVTDGVGLTDVCTQRIFVEHVSDFRVCFPADVTFTDCDDADAGEPQVTDDDCELVAIAHEDLVFNIVDTFCYKIQRTWTVVNWCIYDPDGENTPLGIPAGFLCWRDDGDGYFQYVQIIKVLDDEPPVITSPCTDVTFCDFSGEDDVPGNNDFSESCDGFANLTLTATDACSPASALEFTWRIYALNNTVTPLWSGTGSNASGEYPYGCYLIKWEVEDGCGNIAYCEYEFCINDCKKPAVVCYFGLAAELMLMDLDGDGDGDQGMVVIWASEFLTSWDDNCTPNDQLKLRIRKQGTGTGVPTTTSVTFTCDDYDATPDHTAFVELWVGDNAGNWDFCVTFVTLQNNMGACGPINATAEVSGALETEDQEAVDNATVTATNTNTNAVTPAIISGPGAYEVTLPTGQDYQIEPLRNDDPLNGVTTWDLVLITKHILGVTPLNSPYKIIAADVNSSNNVTAFDLVELRKLILHITNVFPNGTPSWTFVDQNYVFPNPVNPWTEDFPTVVNIDDLSANQVADFVGVKYGDVNGSAAASILLGGEDRNTEGALTFHVTDATIAKGESVTVDFRAGDFNAMGYQFTLNTAGLELTGVKGGAIEVSDENFGVFADAITTSWNGDATLKGDAVLFSLTFKATEAVQLSQALSIGSRITPAEAYGKDSELMDVNLSFNNGVVAASNIFELYQNEPNPFSTLTTIGFNLPESGHAKLVVYDAAGKALKVVEGNYAKGYNSVRLTKAELGVSGVLYYELSTATESATKKMIVIE